MTSPPPPGPRRWPAYLVLALVAVAVAAVWTAGDLDGQVRVTATIVLAALAAFLLLVWLALFSRLPWRRRLAWLGGLAAAAGVTLALVRVEGVTGDFVPVLAWRFTSPPPAPDAETVPASTLPGAADWPAFLGPRRDGGVDGVRLARDWEARPPRELWRRPVGAGWASFAVAGDAAVTLEQHGASETAVRYDLATGAVVWTHAHPARYASTIAGDGPRTTPAIAGGRVYTMGATGVLDALDLATGELVWRRDVVAENGLAVPEWGKSSSPLVVGELVVVPAGGPGTAVVAYDRRDGSLVWQAGDDDPAYATVAALELAGVPQLVVLHRAAVAAYRPADGARLWRVDFWSGQPNVAQPLAVGPDHVLVSTGYGRGSKLFSVTAGGDGELAAREAWTSPRLKSKFANPVLHDGHVYGLDDGVLVCLDPATGERCWKRGRYGHGQVLRVGDLLLVQAEDGAVVLVEARPDEHRELARLQALHDKTWNVPTLAGRYLLVRNHREAACYELPVETAAL